MKLKIVERGFETYTGMFGIVAFENGISVDHVNHVERDLLSALIKCEDFDVPEVVETPAADQNSAAEGEAPAADQTQAAGSEAPAATEGEAPAAPAADQAPAEGEAPAAPAAESKRVTYTREDLEKIADASGINGLREIGDPLNVKATSIAKLIEEILAIAGAQ